MRDVVVVGGGRSATGKRSGALAGMHPVHVAAPVVKQALERAGVEADLVDFVVGGCITQTGEQSHNIARTVSLLVGLPIEVPAVTVDFQCGSSQQGVHLAADMIRAGTADVVIAMGVENMSRVPLGATVANGPGRPFPRDLIDRFKVTRQGTAGENIATSWGITREEADEFGARSHQRAAHAREQGTTAYLENGAPVS
jgi:acetyl-CoA acetyltransferase